MNVDSQEPAASVLEAHELARHYAVSRGMFKGEATLQALRHASFSMAPGRTLAVVGESGCGKSTLARLITLIEPATSGTLTIDGIEVALADDKQQRHLRQAVQIVFQDPYGSLNPRQKIGAILEEPLRINTGLNAAERKAAVDDMMTNVGLRPEHAGRYPHMFSGGQRQRIAVARALMLQPKIVVLDEPVSALDVSIQAQVLKPANRSAGELRSRLPLHLARPVGGAPRRRRSNRDVSWATRGAGPTRPAVQSAAAPLHPSPAGEQPEHRAEGAAAAPDHQG